jgi:hypothetical protein
VDLKLQANMHRLYTYITPFYVRDISIHKFWYLQRILRLWEKSMHWESGLEPVQEGDVITCFFFLWHLLGHHSRQRPCLCNQKCSRRCENIQISGTLDFFQDWWALLDEQFPGVRKLQLSCKKQQVQEFFSWTLNSIWPYLETFKLVKKHMSSIPLTQTEEANIDVIWWLQDWGQN